MLGDGTSGSRSTPAPITALTNIAWLSLGDLYYGLAVDADGHAFTWGRALWGCLGDGASNQLVVGVTQVAGVEDVVQAAAGTHHVVALKRDGTVNGWGARSYGAGNALGDGTGQPSIALPFVIPNLTGVRLVAAAGSYSLFLMEDGTVRMAGSFNDYWPEKNNSHTQVVGLTRIRFIAAGTNQAFALDEDGQLFSWSEGVYGALAADQKKAP